LHTYLGWVLVRGVWNPRSSWEYYKSDYLVHFCSNTGIGDKYYGNVKSYLIGTQLAVNDGLAITDPPASGVHIQMVVSRYDWRLPDPSNGLVASITRVEFKRRVVTV